MSRGLHLKLKRQSEADECVFNVEIFFSPNHSNCDVDSVGTCTTPKPSIQTPSRNERNLGDGRLQKILG